MRKGKTRIVLGAILIILQLVSFAGNAKTGNGIQISFASPALFVYDLIVFVSYCFIGIVGMVLLISGIVAYIKLDTNQNPKNTPENAKQSAAQVSSKQRYCKFCGGAIDLHSKKCTKCGKQYFRVTRNCVIIFCMSLVILLLIGVIVQQNVQHSKDIAVYSNYIAELNSQIENLNNDMAVERQTYYEKMYEKQKEIIDLKKTHPDYS